MTAKAGLAPVVDQKSRILILGTLPGDESIRRQEYYSDPSNQFWRLVSSVFDEATGYTYHDRLEFLADHGVALWDVLQSAQRRGSTDAAITEEQPNDFAELFEQYPDLWRVAFNGTKAEKLWRKHVEPGVEVPLTSTVLPSSSATPGRSVLPFDEKADRWRAFLRP